MRHVLPGQHSGFFVRPEEILAAAARRIPVAHRNGEEVLGSGVSRQLVPVCIGMVYSRPGEGRPAVGAHLYRIIDFTIEHEGESELEGSTPGVVAHVDLDDILAVADVDPVIVGTVVLVVVPPFIVEFIGPASQIATRG